jgi:hypothetical protein
MPTHNNTRGHSLCPPMTIPTGKIPYPCSYPSGNERVSGTPRVLLNIGPADDRPRQDQGVMADGAGAGRSSTTQRPQGLQTAKLSEGDWRAVAQPRPVGRLGSRSQGLGRIG